MKKGLREIIFVGLPGVFLGSAFLLINVGFANSSKVSILDGLSAQMSTRLCERPTVNQGIESALSGEGDLWFAPEYRALTGQSNYPFSILRASFSSHDDGASDAIVMVSGLLKLPEILYTVNDDDQWLDQIQLPEPYFYSTLSKFSKYSKIPNSSSELRSRNNSAANSVRWPKIPTFDEGVAPEWELFQFVANRNDGVFAYRRGAVAGTVNLNEIDINETDVGDLTWVRGQELNLSLQKVFGLIFGSVMNVRSNCVAERSAQRGEGGNSSWW